MAVISLIESIGGVWVRWRAVGGLKQAFNTNGSAVPFIAGTAHRGGQACR